MPFVVGDSRVEAVAAVGDDVFVAAFPFFAFSALGRGRLRDELAAELAEAAILDFVEAVNGTSTYAYRFDCLKSILPSLSLFFPSQSQLINSTLYPSEDVFVRRN